LEGNNGRNGKQMKNGMDGKDMHFGVPVGTYVYEIKVTNQKGK
jgi:GTPase involved in cell partitioning and DNA repair